MAASWHSSGPDSDSQACEPLGATFRAGAAYFRVWAPQAQRIELLLEPPRRDQPTVLTRDQAGYHSAGPLALPPGTTYKLRVNGRGPYPDPFSRFQPHGPHGPSE